MRFRLWEIIVIGILIVGAIAFGFLRSVWSGFAYFSIAILFALLIMFVVSRILYLLDVKKEYDENVDLYLAEKLNERAITRQQFDARDEKILKSYYKSYNKTKRFQIFICVGILAVIVVIILHLTNVW